MRTSQSEFGKLESVVIKRVADAFIDEDKVSEEWGALNYLGKPDLEAAKNEYQKFESILEAQEIDIKYFPEAKETSMDSMYCRDASIMTDYGMILCSMGKEARQPEPAAAENYYKESGLNILGRITNPGTIEGGDVCWLDNKTLAVAHGYRTNDAGFQQISSLLTPFGIEVIQVELPHYKGPADVFHLMSILSTVDHNKAVVYSPLMPIRFRRQLLERGFQLIEVPDEEFESMGCNVLALSPSNCLMVSGNPITLSRLEKANCNITVYDGNEISVKGGGGPTCLTRPLYRSI